MRTVEGAANLPHIGNYLYGPYAFRVSLADCFAAFGLGGEPISHGCWEAFPRGAIDPSRQKYVGCFSPPRSPAAGIYSRPSFCLGNSGRTGNYYTYYAVITCSARKRSPLLSCTIEGAAGSHHITGRSLYGLYAFRVFLAGRVIAFGECYKHIRPGAMNRPLGKPLIRPRGSKRTASRQALSRGGMGSNYFPLG